MTEYQLQGKLKQSLETHDLVVPNFTPRNWYECDMFSLTKSGYVHEHEIKTSRADFRRDASKCQDKWCRVTRTHVRNNKHERLMERDVRGPRYFWYVAPEGVLEPGDMPEFAGLKVWDGWRFNVLVKARSQHSEKVTPENIEQARNCFYYRYWNLREEHERGKNVDRECGRILLDRMRSKFPESEKMDLELGDNPSHFSVMAKFGLL